MPIEVELPDGSIAEFPDGTDNATMERALSQYATPRKAAQPKPRAAPKPAQSSPRQMAGVRTTTSTTETGRKPAQRPRSTSPADLTGISDEQMQPEGYLSHLGRGTADFARAAGHNAMGFLHGTAGLVQEGLTSAVENWPGAVGNSAGQAMRRVTDADQAQMVANEAAYQQNVQDSPASYAGAATGQILPWTVGAPAKLMTAVGARGPGLLAKMAGGARQGAVVGAASPVVNEGEYLPQKAQQVAAATVAGSAGQVVGDALVSSGAKAAQAVSPQLRALYQKAQAMGIQLTPAQLADSGFVRRLALMTDNLPFSGAGARRNAQQAAGNKQLARVLGENADTVDPVVMAQAADRIGTEFDQVFASGMQYDTAFLRRIAALKKEAGEQMDETAVRTMNNWVERLKSQSKQGQISGRTLQSLDQSARKAATGGGDRQMVATEFRDALHDAFGRQATPQAKQAWDTARKQWAMLKTIEPLAAKAPEGGIPLQQLQGAINSTQRGRTMRARGRDGELGDLASIGQRIKPPNSSGSGENVQAASIGAGSIANLPLTLATLGLGGLTSRALASPTLSRLMLRPNAGATRRTIGEAMKRQPLTPLAAKQEQEKKKTK